MKICHRFFACLELFNPKCKGLLSECFFLKLLSFSERFVVWTPQACVTVEVWLNSLNGTASLWNLCNWVAHSAKTCFLLIKKLMPKRPSASGTWIGHSLLARTAFKRKSWKRGTARSMGSRPLVPLLFPLPWLLLLPPCLAWMRSPVAFGKAGLCLEKALLSKGELAVHKWSLADCGSRFDGEKSSLFSAGLLCKWVNGKFCFLRGTMTSPQP